MSAPQSDAPTRSPLAGCMILVIAVLVMVFAVVFMIRVFYRQADEIEKFTEKQPVALAIATATPEQADALTRRASAFRAALEKGESAELALDADDLNRAIALYEPLKDLRGTFSVQSITPNHLKIAISYQLNSRPRMAKEGESGFVTTDPWYLNATLTTRPVLTKGELALVIDQIVPNNGVEAPEPFRQLMSPYRVTERYLQDKQLAPLMAKLTGVELKDDKLVLRRKDGETAPDTISDKQVDIMSGKFFKVLGFAACGFLVLVGLLLVIALRKKAQRENS